MTLLSSPYPSRQSHLPAFQGVLRPDGKVGTRNYLAVLIASNCAASAARFAAEWFDEERMSAWPGVDGVLPLVHDIGCGMEMTGEPMDLLRRTLAGVIRHPNVAGAVVLALGCERNNVQAFLTQEGLEEGPLLRAIVLQQSGGTMGAVQAARDALLNMLPVADGVRRVEVPLSRLTIGLQHYPTTGVSPSATVAIRAAAQTLFRAGARLILADPEPCGALQPHPVYGVPVDACRRYGELAAVDGCTAMQCPAVPDIASTGQVASGATLVLSAFDQPSDFGALPVPYIKMACTPEARLRLGMDMDIAADGGPLHGEVLLDSVARYASGHPTVSERNAAGEAQFNPWPIGVLV